MGVGGRGAGGHMNDKTGGESGIMVVMSTAMLCRTFVKLYRWSCLGPLFKCGLYLSDGILQAVLSCT